VNPSASHSSSGTPNLSTSPWDYFGPPADSFLVLSRKLCIGYKSLPAARATETERFGRNTKYDGAGRKRIPIHITPVSPRLRRKVEALSFGEERGVMCGALT